MSNAPHWQLNDDRRTVTLRIPVGPAAMVLDTAEVESMIANLGEFRGAMLPAVPAELTPGQKVSALHDPRWMTEPNALTGDTLLHIRDPRFGWLHFQIPLDETRKLIALLQAQVDEAPVAPSPERAN